MSAEAGLLGGSATTSDAGAIVEAVDLEVVLPSGDGVGPWSGSIRAGEQVLLLGPSGSGKSTLLRTLAGAIPSHQRARVTGSVRVGGIDPVADGALAAAQVVGHLGQDPADGVCLPQIEDDTALPLESRCTPPEEISARVQGALEQAGIGALADRAAGTLSGGELQRAGLAAAHVARPRLLLREQTAVAGRRRGARRASAAADARQRRRGRRVASSSSAGSSGRGGRAGCGRSAGTDHRARRRRPHPRRRADAPGARRARGCPAGRRMLAAPGARAGAPPGPCPQPAGRADRWCPGPVLLTARDADLGHAERTVLESVELEVRAGEVLAVVGRNGTGSPPCWAPCPAWIHRCEARSRAPRRAWSFQRPEAQFLASTVEDELEASGASPAEVAQMLARLGLAAQAGASPFRLSGGQQRRLSIGAMLLSDRPVLLADEPGYGLDRAAQRTVLDLLREAAEAGRGVVMTTHDLHSLEAADAAVVIAEGRVHGPMPPQALLEDPDLRRAGRACSPGRHRTRRRPRPHPPLTHPRRTAPSPWRPSARAELWPAATPPCCWGC